MTIRISPRTYDENHVVISTTELSNLIEAAKINALVELEDSSRLETLDLMKLAENSGAFDFLLDERENIYTVEDLKVKYK